MSDDDFSSGGGDFGDDSGASESFSSAGSDGGDSYSETSSQSWFSRLGSAITGVIVGLVLFVVAFPLLWWNEGRAVHTAQGLTELDRHVATISPDKVDPAHEGQPVCLAGEAKVSEILADPVFPISATALRLRRVVEMFQWEEQEHSERRRRMGGSEETVKTWTYRTRWNDRVIDSGRFKKAAEHRNPSAMRFPNLVLAAKVVQVGVFRLSPALIAQARNFEPLPLGPQRLGELPEEIKPSAKIDGDLLYIVSDAKGPAPDPLHPRLGDLRIRFEIAPPGPVSLIARQTGDTFDAWHSQSGTTVERLEAGRLTAAEIVGHLQAENNFLTWILRLAGLAAMTFGLTLVLNPLAVLADVLPILGDVLRLGAFVASLLLAGCLSLVTIAAAWLAYRPVLAVVLIAIAAGLLLLLRRMARARKAAAAPA